MEKAKLIDCMIFDDDENIMGSKRITFEKWEEKKYKFINLRLFKFAERKKNNLNSAVDKLSKGKPQPKIT